jgi:hypothetical protein
LVLDGDFCARARINLVWDPMIDLKLTISFWGATDLAAALRARNELLAESSLKALSTGSTSSDLSIDIEGPGSNTSAWRFHSDDGKAEIAAIHNRPSMLSIALFLYVVSGDEAVSEDEIEDESGAFVRNRLDGSP